MGDMSNVYQKCEPVSNTVLMQTPLTVAFASVGSPSTPAGTPGQPLWKEHILRIWIYRRPFLVDPLCFNPLPCMCSMLTTISSKVTRLPSICNLSLTFLHSHTTDLDLDPHGFYFCCSHIHLYRNPDYSGYLYSLAHI